MKILVLIISNWVISRYTNTGTYIISKYIKLSYVNSFNFYLIYLIYYPKLIPYFLFFFLFRFNIYTLG